RSTRDWSSDVCSSDLPGFLVEIDHRSIRRELAVHSVGVDGLDARAGALVVLVIRDPHLRPVPLAFPFPRPAKTLDKVTDACLVRSEERRVGKEFRSAS